MAKEQTPKEAVQLMVEAWMMVAQEASNLAHAKRTLYEAYLSEGFTEVQALELCKSLS